MQRVAAQGQRVALLDGDGAAQVQVGEVQKQHLEGLGVAHQLHVRILLLQALDVGGVVGLHMVDHQIVRLPAIEGRVQIGQELLRFALVHRVHHGDLLIQDDIGIVGHAVGHRILALKQVQILVVCTDVNDVLRDHRQPPK